MNLDYEPPKQFRTASDELHAIVARETGSEDFGGDDYLAGLKVLLQSMDFDPRFSEKGRRAAWGTVIVALRGRARAIQSMKANPGFDARPILAPVVITGVPRTGTTALHRLLAVDDRFQGLQTWLLDSPMPRPPVETWAEHPDFLRSIAEVDSHYDMAPGKRAAHDRAAQEVHEDCMILRQSFVSNLWSCGWPAPTYDAWWQCQSEAAAYDHLHRCVQLIGSNDPDKRWLLKNPGHIDNLDLLFAIFPDAKVILTHRDPAKAVPSLTSLLMQTRGIIDERDTGLAAAVMLQREVAKWSRAVQRCEVVRERHPGQVLDVIHADFHGKPMETVERIYAFIGMEIADDTRVKLARRIEEKPELQHGVHRYDIADFDMTQAEVRAAFGDYVARYDLLEKRG